MSSNTNLAAFFRGDTKVFNLSFKDGKGQPIDITGHEMWFTMKRYVTDLDEDAVLQKRIVFPEGSDSQVGLGLLTMESDETKTLEPGTYFYDMQKVIPGNPPVVATFMSGRIGVISDITRMDGS